MQLAGGFTIITEHPVTVTDTERGQVIRVEVPAGVGMDVELEGPLGLATGLWTPDARGFRTLPADWTRPQATSLVHSAPVLVLHDAQAQALWSLACSEVVAEISVQGGVSEEHKAARLWFRAQPAPDAHAVEVLVDAHRRPVPEAIASLVEWLREVNGLATPEVPARAQQPVFSTWYTYTQDVDDAKVRAEAALAGALGCQTMFIDDGWQTGGHGRGYSGCGDWLADTAKFPDLRATVEAVRGHGLDTVVWIAPLLLGDKADIRDQLIDFAPHHNDHLQCSILDPRFAETRQFVADTCRRLVADFGVAGLKIDFLDNAMVYAGTEARGDIADVGEAMRQMLREVRAALAAEGLPDAIIEFRQPYVSPAITEFGNCLRVGDCPADAQMNRQASLDLRLWTRGAVVHADPLMWAPEAGAAAVAQQFISTFFSVPQVSMPLATLSPEQAAAVKHALSLWQAWREPALFGALQVAGVEQGYTAASGVSEGRAVIAAWASAPLNLDQLDATEVLVLNGTAHDRVLVETIHAWHVVEAHGPSGEPTEVDAPASGLGALGVPAWGSAVLRRN